MKVGIMGLGLVGKAIAQRLMDSGHDAHGYDIASDASDAARAIGVHVAYKPSEVTALCEPLFLCLPDSAARRDLFWGEENLAASLGANHTVLDTSTGRPSDLEEDCERLKAQGTRLVDVCISGSSEAVSKGEALALVGDNEADAPYGGLVDTFAKRAFFFGEPGAGCRVKLLVNVVFGLNRLVLAEALSFAKAAGLDGESILEVLREGDTYSKVMDTKGPKMVSGDFEPVARLSQHAKDVGLILEYASEVGATVPVSELHEKLLQKVLDMGWGDLDNAAIIKAF